MKNYYATTEGTRTMLENEEHNARYTFYTFPVKESNVSDKIVGYQCCIEYAYNMRLGSSHNTRYVSKEAGNEEYKKLIKKGCIKVDNPSFA